MMPENREFRNAILALAIGAFAIGTSEFAAMGLLPYFAADLGITDPQAGHVISAYALGVVIGAPLTSIMGAKLPRRRYDLEVAYEKLISTQRNLAARKLWLAQYLVRPLHQRVMELLPEL